MGKEKRFSMDAFLRLPEDVIEKFGLDVDEFLEQVTQGTD